MADAAQGKVHLCQTIGRRFFLLTVDIDATDVAPFRLDQFRALDEHAARTAARVVQCAVKRFDHGGDQLHDIMRSVVFALFLCRVDGKFLEEVLIDAADQVFLFAKRLVADLVHLIH